MRLWSWSWFWKAFGTAGVATFSAELATRIDRWLDLPPFDWGTYVALGPILQNAFVVAMVVSLIVGCIAALVGPALDTGGRKATSKTQ